MPAGCFRPVLVVPLPFHGPNRQVGRAAISNYAHCGSFGSWMLKELGFTGLIQLIHDIGGPLRGFGAQNWHHLLLLAPELSAQRRESIV